MGWGKMYHLQKSILKVGKERMATSNIPDLGQDKITKFQLYYASFCSKIPAFGSREPLAQAILEINK